MKFCIKKGLKIPMTDQILIADDERNIRLTLSTLLESCNYQVDLAVNGEEAVEKARTNHYLLVLLDMKMSGMDGITTLKHLKKLQPALNVIMMTAYGTIETAVEAMKLGAVDYIRKPFSPEEIKEMVSLVLKRQTAAESAQDYDSLVEYAKGLIVKQDFGAAKEWLRKAIALETSKPEAFYLLGLLSEMEADFQQAKVMYRATLSIDPTYTPAQDNLHRLVEWK
jgi:DNA-binding NtrC family response regulator